MAQKKMFLTPEGLEKLKAELKYLQTVRRHEVAERIRKAKELSDIVDNAEYDDAKNEQAFAEGRILELERTLKDAAIFSIEGAPSDQVKMGSRVKVLGLNGEEKSYTIVGSAEANPAEGKISNESPIGRAILGKKVGEEIAIKVPAGTLRLEIIAIE